MGGRGCRVRHPIVFAPKGRELAPSDKSEEVRRHAERVADGAAPWVDKIARAGYVAKGTVYAAVGVLALREVTGSGGKSTGTSGAFQSIGTQPFGKVLLIVLALGLLCYALWKLVQGVMDPDEKGLDAHGLVRRAGYIGSALIHGGLAVTAAQEVIGTEGKSDAKDDLTAQIIGFAPPLGQILVGVVALGVIGVGLYQLYAGLSAKFEDEIRTYHMNDAARWALLTGRVGTSARAAVILVAGAFLLLAAWQADAQETRGLGGALNTLQQQPYGPYLLGGVAVGLVTYALFMFLVARYRNIEAS